MTNYSLALLAILSCIGPLAYAQTAKGFVKVGSERRELHFARAAEVPDDLEKGKTMLHVILSESPLPAKVLFDSRALYDVRTERKNQVVELNFHKDGVQWFLTGHDMEGMFSLTRSPNPFPYEVQARIAIKGTVVSKSDPDDWPSRTYEISVTYSAPLEKPPEGRK